MPVRGGPYGGAISDLTYTELGATAGDLPPGYRHVTAEAQLGHGPECFRRAVERLMSWDMHRRAGLAVAGDGGRVRDGQTVVLTIRLGPLRVEAPVRVVEVIAQTRVQGFAYGTLPGHPESGEERFIVSQDPDGTVRASIRAFSRPARWYARLGGPISTSVQARTTRGYLDALADGR